MTTQIGAQGVRRWCHFEPTKCPQIYLPVGTERLKFNVLLQLRGCDSAKYAPPLNSHRLAHFTRRSTLHGIWCWCPRLAKKKTFEVWRLLPATRSLDSLQTCTGLELKQNSTGGQPVCESWILLDYELLMNSLLFHSCSIHTDSKRFNIHTPRTQSVGLKPSALNSPNRVWPSLANLQLDDQIKKRRL